jgi:hypothetical protein
MRKNIALRRYFLGLAATATGAAFVNQAGSMWPLALGASFSIVCTAQLVAALWKSRRPG